MAHSVLTELSAGNLFDLTGVVAVVTGGGTGIGLMMSSTLVANGARVYIIGPGQESLDRICKVYNEQCEKLGKVGRMFAIEGDVRQKTEAIRLAGEVSKREQNITVLFNNAGVHSATCPMPSVASAAAYRDKVFETVTEDAFDYNMQTNAIGPYWMTFAFLPLLERWKSGPLGGRFAPQIVMTSSMNGWTKDPATGGFSFPYLMSKSAIGHATASLAHELLPLGIRVNGIAPGMFPTGMTAGPDATDETGASVFPADKVHDFQVPVTMRGGHGSVPYGTTKDIGGLVLFLVANWFVDGETVLIDGGTMLKHPSSY